MIVGALGPLLSGFCGSPSAGVLLAGACTLVTMLVLTRSAHDLQLPRFVWIAQWIWFAVLAGSCAPIGASCWPDGDTFPVVPLVLLVLAAFAAKSGGENLARCAAVLLWVVLAAVGVLLGIGAREWKWDLLTTDLVLPDAYLAVAVLLPCVSLFLSPGVSVGKGLPLLVFGIAVAIVLGLTGVLSVEGMRQAANPFYTYAQCVRMGGASWRMEPLASCVMTMGWFLFLAILLTCAGNCAARIQKDFGSVGVICGVAVAAVWTLCKVNISPWWIVLGCTIFWVVVPLLAQIVPRAKKDEKKRK